MLWCLWMGLLALGRPLGGGAESETGLCEWPPEFPSPQAPSDDPLSAHLTGAAADGYQLGRHGLAIVEDACQALGARHSDGTPVGGRGNPAVFGFYANKQITTGEGGMIALGDPEMKARIECERNQGGAPDMDWLDHDRLGFNYRLSEIACAGSRAVGAPR